MEIAVKCKHDEMINIDDLNPNPANANVHPAIQIELYATILKYQGWRVPIRVSKRSGFMTKGHGALEAARYLTLKEVPVEYQEYADEEQELADLVADNQLAKQSELDNRKLQDVLVQLDSGAFDMKLTGFSEVQLEKLFTGFGISKTELKLQSVEGEIAGHDKLKSQEGEVQQSDFNSEIGAETKTSHVRMVQLFLNEDTQKEFLTIVEYFQEKLKLDNVTDTVMEMLRAVYRSYQQETQENEDDKSDVSAPQG